VSEFIKNLFNALEIRDTDAHYSAWVPRANVQDVLIAVASNLDAVVAVQVQGAKHSTAEDGAKVWDVGSPIGLEASDGSTYLTNSGLLDGPWPYLRVKVQAVTVPTAGDLDASAVG